MPSNEEISYPFQRQIRGQSAHMSYSQYFCLKITSGKMKHIKSSQSIISRMEPNKNPEVPKHRNRHRNQQGINKETI